MNAHLTSFYISESLMNKTQDARRKNGVMSCTEQEFKTIEKHLPLWEVAYTLALGASPFWKDMLRDPIAHVKFAMHAHQNLRWDQAQLVSAASICYYICVALAGIVAYAGHASLLTYLLLGAGSVVGYGVGVLVRKMYLISYLMLHLVNEEHHHETTASFEINFVSMAEPETTTLSESDRRVLSMVMNYVSFKQLFEAGRVKICRDLMAMPTQKMKINR